MKPEVKKKRGPKPLMPDEGLAGPAVSEVAAAWAELDEAATHWGDVRYLTPVAAAVARERLIAASKRYTDARRAAGTMS